MARLLDPLIRNHIDTILSSLSTGREFSVDDLIPTYLRMKPILHHDVQKDYLDLNSLSYSLLRLPDDIFLVTKVILVQSYEDIKSIGFDVTKWAPVPAFSRRRLTYINPAKNTIACMLSSESDIHDLINCLIAFHLERLKIKKLLNQNQPDFIRNPDPALLKLTADQWSHLKMILGPNWEAKISSTMYQPGISIKMYGRDPPLYQTNSTGWLTNLLTHSLVIGLKQSPVYFVSSNSHSLVNIIGGFINQKSNYIFDYISRTNQHLYHQWFEVKKRNNTSRVNDFLYYVAGNFLQDNPDFVQEKAIYENDLGIKTIKSTDAFQSNTQVIPLKSLSFSHNLDSNLKIENPGLFSQSDAYIINIEYPLGYAAYYLFNEILSSFTNLQAAYVLGKAAILRGSVGDIQIPHIVYDEMTDNLYTFKNIFKNNSFLESYISRIYPNQHAACVYGTFLENEPMINRYLQSGINVIEMESGPFLKVFTEKYLTGRPVGRGCNYDLTAVPFQLGIINYASDNPLSQTLAEESITLRGVEPTYLSSLAVLDKIINAEKLRLSRWH